MLFGRSSSDQAPQVSRTRSPNSVPGIDIGTEPVAMTTFFVSWTSSPTLTLPSSVSEASPSITVILFFLKRPATPPVSVLRTLSRRS